MAMSVRLRVGLAMGIIGLVVTTAFAPFDPMPSRSLPIDRPLWIFAGRRGRPDKARWPASP
jgi:hypothetical protein